MNLATNLPDPIDLPQADIVIFDGECQFCQGQVARLARFDRWGKVVGRGGKLAFLSLHDPRVAALYPDLTHDMLMEQMYVVDRQGLRHGGADAIRYLSRRLPILWPMMPIMHIPGSAGMWRWMYQQVARRRYRWNKPTCDNGACAVHLGEKKRI